MGALVWFWSILHCTSSRLPATRLAAPHPRRRAQPLPQQWLSSLPLEQAVDLVKGAFVSAGERDIYTVSVPRPRRLCFS